MVLGPWTFVFLNLDVYWASQVNSWFFSPKPSTILPKSFSHHLPHMVNGNSFLPLSPPTLTPPFVSHFIHQLVALSFMFRIWPLLVSSIIIFLVQAATISQLDYYNCLLLVSLLPPLSLQSVLIAARVIDHVLFNLSRNCQTIFQSSCSVWGFHSFYMFANTYDCP